MDGTGTSFSRKYGAAEADLGSKNAGDIPVDAHELIALCAPRPTSISYGVPEKGDAKWLDHQGSYMAAIAAGPVFSLLGAKDLGVSNDYKGGEDACRERQHARRPTRLAATRRRTHRRPELEIFHFLGRQKPEAHPSRAMKTLTRRTLCLTVACVVLPLVCLAQAPADQPVSRTDQNSLTAHAQLLEKTKKGRIDIYFEGDSITRRWGATDYPQLLVNWKEHFSAGTLLTSGGAPTRFKTFSGASTTVN